MFIKCVPLGRSLELLSTGNATGDPHKVATVDGLYDEYFMAYIYEVDGGQKRDSDFFFTLFCLQIRAEYGGQKRDSDFFFTIIV